MPLWIVIVLGLIRLVLAERCRCDRNCPIYADLSDTDCICRKCSGLYKLDFKTGTCGDLEDHCTEGRCANGGTCRPRLGSYYCSCPQGYAGQDCNITVTGTKRYPTDVSVFFDIREQAFGRGVSVFVAVEGAGAEVEMRLDDGSGWIRKRADLALVNGNPRDICLRQASRIPDADFRICHELVPSGAMEVGLARVEYPVIGDEDSHLLKTARGDVVGRLDHLRLEVSAGGRDVFSAEYPVFTYFTHASAQCARTPLLRHCSGRSDKPTEYRRGEEIVLRAENRPVSGGPCPRRPSLRHRWRLFGAGVDMELLGDSVLRLQPSDLPFGPYTVEYRVEALASPSLASPSQLFTNVARCWLSVVAMKVVAEIRGGSLRTHKAGRPLALSAVPSMDPNYPDDTRLRYSWSCTPSTSCHFSSRSRTDKRLKLSHVPPGLVQVQLEVHSEGLHTILADTFVQTVDVRTTGVIYPGFLIVCCKTSCQKPNPGHVVCLKLPRYPKNVNIDWTVQIGGGAEVPVLPMRQAGTPPHILVIKAGTLQYGTSYDFKAVYRQSVSVYSLRTEDDIQPGVCHLQPPSGQALTTEFTLECTGFNGPSPFLYQLFQLTASAQGRLLSSSRDPVIPGLRLASGNLEVAVVSSLGTSHRLPLSVSVGTSAPLTGDEIANLLTAMKLDLDASDVTAALATAHLLATNLAGAPDQKALVRELLDLLAAVALDETGDAEAVAQCLETLLTAAGPSMLDSGAVRTASGIFQSIGTRLLQLQPLQKQLEHLKLLVGTVLQGMDPLLGSRDPRLSNSAKPEEYEEAYWNYEKGSEAIMEAVGSMGDLLLATMVEHQDALRIDSLEFALLTKVCSGKCLGEEVLDPSGDGKADLTFPSNVYTDTVLKLQVTEMKSDLMWWSPVTNSRLLLVRLFRHGNPIHSLPRPITLHFKAIVVPGTEEMEGHVKRTSSDMSEELRDTKVAVHRLARSGTGRAVFTFLDLGTVELKVLGFVNELPGVEAVESRGQLISRDHPVYATDPYLLAEDDFFYIGIIPADKHAVGETVQYKMRAVEQTCKVWDHHSWDLATSKVVGDNLEEFEVHCASSHLSLFGSSILVAPFPLSLAQDIHLFRGLADNPFVFLVVLFFLLTYVAFFVWAYKRDKRDKDIKGIHLLQDNFPGEKFGYLVAVFTGEHFGAGTTANVGIRLMGTQASSHAHILNLNKRLLQMGQDSWLLVFAHKYLGDLREIHLWLDCSGSRPSWYCNKVMVYDLEEDLQNWFVVNSYLSPWQPEIHVPRLEEEVKSVRVIARDNFINGIREKHLWLSIFARHPRSAFTRRQTLTITLSMVFISMLSGLMFLGVKEEAEDNPDAHFGNKNLIISLEGLVICVAVSTVSVSCFRATLAESKKSTTEESSPQNRRLLKRLWDLMKRQFWALFTLPPLETIRLYERPKPPALKQRLLKVLAWTVHLLLLLVCGFLLVLYGLKYGPNRSFLWSAVVAISLLKNIFLFAPLKVAFFTLIAALVCKISNRDLLTFEVEPEPIPGGKLKKSKYMKKLIELRRKPMYRPMSLIEIREVQKKQRQEKERGATWCLFLAVSMFIVQLFLALMLVEYSQVTVPYPTQVIDKISLKKYINEDLLTALYTTIFNNQQSLPMEEGEVRGFEKGWTGDYMYKLVGVPRVRQLRITSGSCHVPQELRDWFEECHGSLASGTLETGSFAFEWKNEGRAEWNYTPPSANVALRGWSGKSYPDGGYMVDLGPTWTSAVGKMAYLHVRGWLDSKTRAVILEAPLFGPHCHRLVHLTLVAEILPSSVYTASLIVESTHYEFSLKEKIGIATIYGLLIIFLMCWLTKVMIYMSSDGFIQFFRKWRGILDLMVVALGLGTVAMTVARAFDFKRSVLQLEGPVRDEYVDFASYFHMSDTLALLLSSFILVTTVSMISLCHFGKYFYVCCQALKNSAHYILAILIFTLVLTGLISLLMFSCGAQHHKRFPALPFPKEHFVHFHLTAGLQNESIFFPILINSIYLLSNITIISILVYHYGKAKFSLIVRGEGWGTNRLKRICDGFLKRTRRFLQHLCRWKRHKEPVDDSRDLDMQMASNETGDTDWKMTPKRIADLGLEPLPTWLAKRKSTHKKLIKSIDMIINALDKQSTKAKVAPSTSRVQVG